MLILLSPSKTIDTGHDSFQMNTQPLFIKESSKLVNKIKKLNTGELSKLMSISPKLAQQTYDRFQFWNKEHNSQNSKQAILSFKGEVYNGLAAASFSEKDLSYSQEHLIILSGLYGVLRSLDLIQPYRLEIATKLSVQEHKDLYSYWGNKITNEINRVLEETSNEILVNLASIEYFKSIDTTKLKSKIITPVFKDNKNGAYKIISIYAKKARGLMSNYIIRNKINSIEELLLFDEEGYYYNEEHSKANELAFIRG